MFLPRQDTSRTKLSVTQLTQNAVVYVSQVFVDDCKKSGNFDKEAQAKAFNMAKTAALNMISDNAKKYIEKYCGDLDEWLKIQIEAAVKTNKTLN